MFPDISTLYMFVRKRNQWGICKWRNTVEIDTYDVDYGKARRFALSSVHIQTSVQSPTRDRPAE